MLGYHTGLKLNKIQENGDWRSNALNNLGYDRLISADFHTNSIIEAAAVAVFQHLTLPYTSF